MLLSELIQEDVIKIGLEATNKWEAIEELVDLLISAHELRLNDRAEVLEAVYTRERSLSTGLERGLAVPHGAVDCVHDIVAALGVSKQGVPFETLDGKLAHIVVLLVIPRNTFQQHVRTLAGIARLVSNGELRQRVLQADRPQQVVEAFNRLEMNPGRG